MHCYIFLPVANETAESHSGMGNLKSSRMIYLKIAFPVREGLDFYFVPSQGMLLNNQ